MENLVYFFPFFFIAMWIFVTYYISKMGWADLAEHYKTREKFIGKRVGLISATINNANYNNSLILKYNDVGFHINPIFLFRLFHDPILIPWKDIKEVRDKQFLFFHFKELIIGNPFIAIIKIKKATFIKMERDIYSILQL